ncbi:MAG: 2Fe-2S iron-sulfur cluster binding domain-containing protein [Candidatus Aminicenantes bacterium]|nr:2Fe-2S iron-sulfur cluster binding domain-containing protein [Candidatus Aminicenantes bacterium]
MSFFLNDREPSVSRTPGTVLLDVLREDLGLTGTKDGCREGDCGTCLVLVGVPRPEGIVYRAVNSCLFPMGDAAGRHVVTIEGLNQAELSPVQQALVEEGAIQCGFCTPGLVVALTGFLLSGAPLSEADGVAALGGNICRCTGYAAIRRAVARLVGQFPDLGPIQGFSVPGRIEALVKHRVLPPYFLDVPARLRALPEPSAEIRSKEGDARPPVLVAGGTDLFVTQAEALREAELAFLSRREDLQGIRLENGLCRVGAATPLIEIEESPDIRRILPGLGRHFARIASLPVRNRATVAGNIVNASPAGDLSVIFLALDATVVLARERMQRIVALRDFFRGYKIIDLSPDEVIVEIRFPVPDAATRFDFEKVGRRDRLDIASASSAIRLRVLDGRIVEAHAAAGSVAPVPLYLRETSAFLRGQVVSAATAREAAAVAGREISPISDIRGSAGYKHALLPRLILAHFLTLFPERIREEDLA